MLFSTGQAREAAAAAETKRKAAAEARRQQLREQEAKAKNDVLISRKQV
jgi:hypothetical protein